MTAECMRPRVVDGAEHHGGARVGLCQRLGTVGQRVSGDYRYPRGRIERAEVEAQLLRESLRNSNRGVGTIAGRRGT